MIFFCIASQGLLRTQSMVAPKGFTRDRSENVNHVGVEARSILPSDRALFPPVWDAVSRANLLFVFWENATEGNSVATN